VKETLQSALVGKHQHLSRNMSAYRRTAVNRWLNLPLLLGTLCAATIALKSLKALSFDKGHGQKTVEITLKPAPVLQLAAGGASTSHACSRVSLARPPAAASRPKLMIIISETTDRKGRQETAHVIDNFLQYCQRHGYLFQLHHYETDPSVGVFGTRWRDAFKYWCVAGQSS
jgi:hypothetical protein